MEPREISLRKQQGLTLVELLTTLAVAALLLSLAAPSFQRLIAAQRLRAASFDLMSDLVLARNEALKRSASVQVTAASGGWAQGWVVQAVGGTEPLASHSGMGSVRVTSGPDSVTFDLNGRVADAVSIIRIGLTDGDTRYRCISLDPAGRPRATTTGCPS